MYTKKRIIGGVIVYVEIVQMIIHSERFRLISKPFSWIWVALLHLLCKLLIYRQFLISVHSQYIITMVLVDVIKVFFFRLPLLFNIFYS